MISVAQFSKILDSWQSNNENFNSQLIKLRLLYCYTHFVGCPTDWTDNIEELKVTEGKYHIWNVGTKELWERFAIMLTVGFVTL